MGKKGVLGIVLTWACRIISGSARAHFWRHFLAEASLPEGSGKWTRRRRARAGISIDRGGSNGARHHTPAEAAPCSLGVGESVAALEGGEKTGGKNASSASSEMSGIAI